MKTKSNYRVELTPHGTYRGLTARVVATSVVEALMLVDDNLSASQSKLGNPFHPDDTFEIVSMEGHEHDKLTINRAASSRLCKTV